MVEAKAKDRGHYFCKLWSPNFPLFSSAKVFKILRFVKFLMLLEKSIVYQKIMNVVIKFYTVAGLLTTCRSGIMVMKELRPQLVNWKW